MIEPNSAIQGDCIEIMWDIPDKSVDMINSDLPYGITVCKWDIIIPFEPLWEQYKRIIKDNGAIVLTASQPFTSKLVMSNLDWFKYEWIWDKVMLTGHLTAKIMPMKLHENILVFYKNPPTFNRQFTQRPVRDQRPNEVANRKKRNKKEKPDMYGQHKKGYAVDYDYTKISPKSIITFAKNDGMEMGYNIHPTQKPVSLYEYLIMTYTNEGDLVLDNCAGSFATAIACINTRRNWICIEKDPEYCEKGWQRIKEANRQLRIF